jgi:hypothetical protein
VEQAGMNYIIMADGKTDRWHNYLGIPKHFIELAGEPIIKRTIRLLHDLDPQCSVTVTSHDPNYEFEGAHRHEPLNNVLEVDRFTQELIADGACFLYGDTYYTEEALTCIIETAVEDVLFFGNHDSIVAIKMGDSALFSEHVMRVRSLFLQGEIAKCTGWQVYQSMQGLPFEGKTIGENYVLFSDNTIDFNEPEDYLKTISRYDGNPSLFGS